MPNEKSLANLTYHEGRPRGSKNAWSIDLFIEALKEVGDKKKKSLFVRAVEQAYKDNKVLIALLNKVLPDKIDFTGSVKHTFEDLSDDQLVNICRERGLALPDRIARGVGTQIQN